MIITLKRDGQCKQCGAQLSRGTRARWYRNGDVYGFDCHGGKGTPARSARASYQGEDYECSDLGYEDQCARATGNNTGNHTGNSGMGVN